MNNIDFNKYLNRESEMAKIASILAKHNDKDNHLAKKGIYVYGNTGIGKTTFVVNLLTQLGYDVIKYDAGDIRNKPVIDNITKHNMSDKNIMSLFKKTEKKIVIVMDEIDGMNNGDKGGINTLIKLIRPKKTKKQRAEDTSITPIICIGNYKVDKKIKELMKVCNTIELKTPTKEQMVSLIDTLVPGIEENLKTSVLNFVQGDIRKLKIIYDMYVKNCNVLNYNVMHNIFQTKTNNDDAKKIVQNMLSNQFKIDQHSNMMNETDRTIVGLLWHENIVDHLNEIPKKDSLPFYLEALDNMCLADYIDRITFQKQIWQLNELSSLIKTFKNNKLYHDTFVKSAKQVPNEIRFTKVLTKYSTEYNNSIFLQSLCSQLGMDKKDVLCFFLNLKTMYEEDTQILELLEQYDITKLDINRIYRYLDKYTKDVVFEDDFVVDELVVAEEEGL
jgi:DNA polymerase III delta prime subunit